MATQPFHCKRTVRHDDETTRSRVVDRGPYQCTADAAPFELVGHTGVVQLERVVAALVEELGDMTVDDDGKARLVGLVDDDVHRASVRRPQVR